MTGSLAGALAGNLTHAAAVTTLPAVGVQRLAWLLLAFPTAGAAILLLGGRRTERLGSPARMRDVAGLLRRTA